jgi:hypothetical protein
VGFGWSSGTWVSSCGAPSYCNWSYLPWSYYCATGYYPAMSSVQYATIVVDRTESMDPYVSYDDVVTVATVSEPVRATTRVPAAFHQPYVGGFPEALSAGECLARGEGWLRSRDYLLAAEAFRRAWLERDDDAFAAAELGVALAAAGRYEAAALAIQCAFSADALLTCRLPDLWVALLEQGRLERDVVRPLQADLRRNPAAQATSYVLACAHLAAGDPWSAQRELGSLSGAGFTHHSLALLESQCEAAIAAAGAR